MAVHICASYRINTGDGSACKKIFQTQQANVRTVTVGSDAVCNSRLFGVFPDTIFVETSYYGVSWRRSTDRLYSWQRAAAPNIATSLSFNSETRISTVPL